MIFIFKKKDRRLNFLLKNLEKITEYCLVLFVFMEIVPSLLWAAEADNFIPFTEKSLKSSSQGELWDREAPVDIHAEQLNVDFEAHQIIFKGDVKVTQADFFLSAREVIASFGENADDIERIVAKGNVDIQKADKRAWGEEACYDRKEATIVLRGNPSLRQGKNLLKGKEIRVLLDEDRMEIKGAVMGEFHLLEKLTDNGQVPLDKAKE